MTYIWQQADWPRFRWDGDTLLAPLGEARHKQGWFLGHMAQLGFELKLEAELLATTDDVMKTSAIEGESLDLASVRSSVAKRLGLAHGGIAPVDRKVEGIVEMMLDAAHNHARPLTVERLFGWHAGLFPTGFSGLQKLDVGGWRKDREGPMQVISGAYGRRRIHYEAPPADRLSSEVEAFLAWFNGPLEIDPLLRSGLAHFWFVTIHPFDDGNGRIARAIADMALAQAERTGQRFYSVSAQIQRERNRYYEALERTQKGSLDVTEWLSWFVPCFSRAIGAAEEQSRSVLCKAEFWRRVGEEPLSARQRTVLNRFLDGFEGTLTANKWAALGKCSVDTAQRDIHDLVSRGLLIRNPGGSRRTSYNLAGLEEKAS